MKVCDSLGLANRDSKSPAPLPPPFPLIPLLTAKLQQLQGLTPICCLRDAVIEQVMVNKAFAGCTGAVFHLFT